MKETDMYEKAEKILKKVSKPFYWSYKLADLIFASISHRVYALTHSVDKNQIMFIPFQGEYTCNPKYIAEEVLRRNTDYKLIFSLRPDAYARKESLPDGVERVLQYSPEYYRAIMTSKVIVANSVEFLKRPCPKPKGQTIFETWHGSLGIKRVDKAVYKSSISWVMAAELCGKYADYCISNSTFENEVYRGTYWQNNEILEYGHARNDILFDDSPERKNTVITALEKRYGASLAGYRLALYAPTFRDDYSYEAYSLDIERLSAALALRFGGQWKFLVRLHPSARQKMDEYYRTHGRRKEGFYSSDSDIILHVTDYPDMQELLVVTDFGITDYSSWIYDYLLRRKTGLLFATDRAAYDVERGLYFPLESTPFPVAENNDEAERAVLDFDEKKFSERCEDFIREKGCWDDGHAAERIADKIAQFMAD